MKEIKQNNKFDTLQDSKAKLLEEYKGNEVIEFMINNLYDVNPGSNVKGTKLPRSKLVLGPPR